MTLFFPLGFGVLLQSGSLKATANLSLHFVQQAKLSTYGGLQCVPNLQSAFRTVLNKLMMQEYKKAKGE